MGVKLIIGLLLFGYISTSPANLSTSEHEVLSDAIPEQTQPRPSPSQPGLVDSPHVEKDPVRRTQVQHLFSEPVIISIIFTVMAGVIGTILFLAYCIGRLTKKSSPDIQTTFSSDTGEALNSVETGNPESNQ